MQENGIKTMGRKVALQDLATEIANRLIRKGFVVYRYDAYSTNSIYLKLDFGVCNSIRISDHYGKKHLKYRYNIGADIKKIETKQDQYPRHYFPASEVDRLIQKIVEDRKLKQKRYGMDAYERYMKENKEKQGTEAGFWSKAYRVL